MWEVASSFAPGSGFQRSRGPESRRRSSVWGIALGCSSAAGGADDLQNHRLGGLPRSALHTHAALHHSQTTRNEEARQDNGETDTFHGEDGNREPGQRRGAVRRRQRDDGRNKVDYLKTTFSTPRSSSRP
ncbi:hypothetical protein B2J93_3686 [Marssonina coronariae]|uniref:Uncharacterized protein n=1 Tax=Diplocarpon coronariae TaxID=2795749 RepID=A0A218Z638_9HELO|nr:hypothetical protein B2J93_3686 [Marssonina coronariae]